MFEISKNDNLINFWILILKNKDELRTKIFGCHCDSVYCLH